MSGPKMFDGLTAWFSNTVDTSRLQTWVRYDGEVNDLEDAMFIFSEDASAEDTKPIFFSNDYLQKHIAVFHASFIDECVRLGHPNYVAIGKFLLPHEVLHQSIKDRVRFRWESLVEQVKQERILREKVRGSCPGVKKMSDMQDALEECIDIALLPNVAGDITEFTVGRNGCEVFKI